MEKIFLHIGLMKTATTFFQEVVFPRLTDTLFLPKEYIKFNHAFEKLKYADDTLYDENEIINEFNKYKHKKVLISSETLAGNPRRNSINRSTVARRLKKLFPNATIILFIRGQFDILLSFYKLYVQERNEVTQPINQFYSYPLDYETSYQFEDISKNTDVSNYRTYYREKIHLENFKYYEIIKLYKKLFDNVQIFLYEDFVKTPLQFVSSLEELLEDNSKNKEDIDFNVHYRKSISNIELDHKLFINKLTHITNKKVLIYPLYYIYKNIHKKNHSIKSFFDKIQGYYVENNNLIIKKYPEIGIQNYPQKYQF